MSKEAICAASCILVKAADLRALNGDGKVYTRWTLPATPKRLRTRGRLVKLIAPPSSKKIQPYFWVSFDEGNWGYAWIAATRQIAREHRIQQHIDPLNARLANPLRFIVRPRKE